MANYKVAYGKRENISLAIEKGIIPTGCLILTNEGDIFFYDLESNLTAYEQRYRFDSLEEATKWAEYYSCQGQIFSVHEGDTCNLYIVEYDNKLKKISGSADYEVHQRDPTPEDYDYPAMSQWINLETENIYVLVTKRNSRAVWRCITNDKVEPDKHYKYTQSVASAEWRITHNLNKRPSVTTVDSSESIVVGEVTYIDSNSLVIKFQGAFSGKAYLN